MEETERLQSKIQEVLVGITPEDHSSWLGHPCTKVLLKTLELDLKNLQTTWTLGGFSEEKLHSAQGQAFYILGMEDDCRHMLRGVERDAD